VGLLAHFEEMGTADLEDYAVALKFEEEAEIEKMWPPFVHFLARHSMDELKGSAVYLFDCYAVGTEKDLKIELFLWQKKRDQMNGGFSAFSLEASRELPFANQFLKGANFSFLSISLDEGFEN